MLMLIALILLVARSEGMPQSHSARRHVEIPEHDLTTSKVYLLDRSEVQKELSLTASQVRATAEAWNAPFESIPGFSEWQTRYKKLSEAEKRQQKSQYMKERDSLISKWLESRLADILNDKQKDRLDALVLQMRGPKAILTVDGVARKLRVASEQTAKIQDLVNQYKDEAAPLYQRYGHNMLQRSRSSQTIEEAEKEQDALVVIITEIVKARDEAILSVLTKEQRDQWGMMQGRLLPVSWPETAGFYVPFKD
jgi:hypothetical protein